MQNVQGSGYHLLRSPALDQEEKFISLCFFILIQDLSRKVKLDLNLDTEKYRLENNSMTNHKHYRSTEYKTWLNKVGKHTKQVHTGAVVQ